MYKISRKNRMTRHSDFPLCTHHITSHHIDLSELIKTHFFFISLPLPASALHLLDCHCQRLRPVAPYHQILYIFLQYFRSYFSYYYYSLIFYVSNAKRHGLADPAYIHMGDSTRKKAKLRLSQTGDQDVGKNIQENSLRWCPSVSLLLMRLCWSLQLIMLGVCTASIWCRHNNTTT